MFEYKPSYNYKIYKSKRFHKTKVDGYYLIWNTNQNSECHLNFNKELIFKNSLIVLNPGESFYCSAGLEEDLHIINFDNTESAVINVIFNNWLYEQQDRPSIIRFRSESADRMNAYMKDLFEVDHRDKKNKTLTHYIVNSIIHEALNVKLNNKFELPLAFNQLVKNQYSETHLVSEYAESLNVKPKILLNKLQDLGVKKPSHVIKDRILQEVKALLLETDHTVKEVCYKAGFDDPAYFARFFKKNTGVSALKFKKHFKSLEINENSPRD